MKLKLIIIDAEDAPHEAAPPQYFITEGHIDSWRYSPPASPKIIESRFDG